IGSQLVRLRVGMLVNFPGLEIEKLLVPGILQHQGLLTVADDDPVALPYFDLLHAMPLRLDLRSTFFRSTSVEQTPQSRFSCPLRAAAAQCPAPESPPRLGKC